MRSTQNGFTLVEIAIVLVIIGLLLGGVLKQLFALAEQEDVESRLIVQAQTVGQPCRALCAQHRDEAGLDLPGHGRLRKHDQGVAHR